MSRKAGTTRSTRSHSRHQDPEEVFNVLNPNTEQQIQETNPGRHQLVSTLIPTYNAGSNVFLQFLEAILAQCNIHCARTVATVNWDLIKKNVEDIYIQIWFLSGTEHCPKYMTEDKGRLIKLCQLLFPHKIDDTIILEPSEYATVIFLMACMRVQSLRGNRKKDSTLTDEEFKEMQRVRCVQLTADDIKDRIERELPYNIAQYYCVIITEQRVEIIDKQKQSFKPLFDPVKFSTFMVNLLSPSSMKKRENAIKVNNNNISNTTQRVQKATKRKYPPSDSDDSYSEEVLQQGSCKSPRLTLATTPRGSEAIAPAPVPTQPALLRTSSEESKVAWPTQLQNHLDLCKGSDINQYYNCARHLMLVLQVTLQSRGLSETEAITLIVDPSLVDDPRVARWLEVQLQQANYVPTQYQARDDLTEQGTMSATSQPAVPSLNTLIMPQCTTPTQSTQMAHSPSLTNDTQASTVTHDTYPVALSPRASDELLGGIHAVNTGTGHQQAEAQQPVTDESASSPHDTTVDESLDISFPDFLDLVDTGVMPENVNTSTSSQYQPVDSL